MKLKTLKDLGVHNCEFCDSVTYRREELKQEAIKWVKNKLNKQEKAIKNNEIYNVNWFMVFTNFHNITEDDIK